MGENFIHTKQGYCFYSTDSDHPPLIFGLYTEPEYRGQGYAKKHLQFIIEELRKSGCHGDIQIEVEPGEEGIDGQRLTVFYQNLGLTVIETAAKSESGGAVPRE